MVLTVATDVRSRSPDVRREELDVGEWMSVTEAAELLEVTARTVQRSLSSEERRTREWGAENEGWRHKPLAERTIYQLRRSAVLRKAGHKES
jgi:hypothetical protein